MNISVISQPYNWDYHPTNGRAIKVIFFGSDFKNLSKSNIGELIRLTNGCLEYIRRNCHGLKLYYKFHPGETDESKLLNLEGFELVRDNNNAEMFLYKNREEIKYAFSQNSTASSVAFSFGINSYVFLEPFQPVVGKVATNYWRETLFAEMPDNFFIKSKFNQLTIL